MNPKDVAIKYRKNGESVIAYNECHWSEMAITHNRYAILYGDINTNKLRLLIIEEHTQSGMAIEDETTKLINTYVGTFQQPDCNKIKHLLNKYTFDRTRAGMPFNQQWYKGFTNQTTNLYEYIKLINNKLDKIKTRLNTVKDDIDINDEINQLNVYVDETLKRVLNSVTEKKLDTNKYVEYTKKVKFYLGQLNDLINKL